MQLEIPSRYNGYSCDSNSIRRQCDGLYTAYQRLLSDVTRAANYLTR